MCKAAQIALWHQLDGEGSQSSIAKIVKDVAALLGVAPADLIRVNAVWYKGLSPRASLQWGTALMIPSGDGVRGAPPLDIDALADALARLSVFAAENADVIETIDITPFLVLSDGAVAVDALIVPKTSM